jgi:hypothetical protein
LAANPVIVQSLASASSSAAPASFSPAFAATAAGNLLVAICAYAASGAVSLTPPAGWQTTGVVISPGNTIGGRILYLPNNPGGVTTVALTGLAGINGIAVALLELSAMLLLNPLGQLSTAASNSSTTPASGALTPTIANALWLGYEADLTGQAYTPANLPSAAGYWATGPTATSTVGATNAVLRAYTSLPGPMAPPGGVMSLAGTLAGALANVAGLVAMLSVNASQLVNAGTGQTSDVMVVAGGAGGSIGSA